MSASRLLILCFALGLMVGCDGGSGHDDSPAEAANSPAATRTADGAVPAVPASSATAQAAEPAGDTQPDEGADASAVEPLALAATDSNMDSGTLALVLTFNKRLAGTQDFDALAQVTDHDGMAVRGGWALSDSGLSLRFTPVDSNSSYQVHVDGAVAAADGTELGAALDKDIKTGALEPMVSFASRGSVLPAHGSRGLPVMAVNTPEVEVQFYRVRDDELSDFFAAYTHNGLRSSYDLDPENGWYHRPGQPVTDIADAVYSHRFVLDCPANQRCINYLPIGDIEQLAPTGVYFAVMRATGNLQNDYATSVFYVSNIGLHMRVYPRKVFVHAASLETGEPLGGVRLTILDKDGEPQVVGQTDDDGNALLAYEFASADVLRATLDGDVALLPFNRPALNLSAFDVAGRQQTPLDVFAWSGRDLYRPGETLQLSALLRDHDGHMVAAQPLFVRVKMPDGRTLASKRLQADKLGYYQFKQAIPETGPTGTWRVEFRLDPGADEPVLTQAFHIEEFLPERLELQLSAARPTTASGQPLGLEVSSSYLYGAPASGNRFSATLGLKTNRHPVESLPDFWFGDPSLELPEGVREVLDAELDENGKLSTPIELFQAEPPATSVTAIIRGSVFETGGRPVTRTLRQSVWPADALVGVHPQFDPEQGATPNATAVFQLVRVNSAGERLAARDLEVQLQREHRRYHWYWTDAGGWNFDWSSEFETLATRTVSIAAGQSAGVELPIKHGGYRLSVTDPATGLVTRYRFHAGWGWDGANHDRGARPDKVKMVLDQTGYQVGDTLTLTITPPKPGPGLLLVESDHLIHQQTIHAEPGATFKLPVTEQWMRHDVYITVLVFRGGTASEHSTPARAVGEVHVPIERSQRKLDVAITAPDKMRPGHQLTVAVDAPQLAGQQGEVTVSAVDVGVLNITRFEVPAPFQWFFAQRAFGVDAYDVYARIIEAFEGGTARLAWGGDMALKAMPQAHRARATQDIIDLFSGPVAFDDNGHAEATLTMPEFNGTVRITAVAFGKDRFGSASSETLVRAPIVLQASTPRVLAPGDQSLLTVDITNFTGADADITLTATAGPGLTIDKPEHSVTLAKGESTSVTLPIMAGKHFGPVSVDIRARSGATEVHIDRELVVRAAWPAVTRAQTRVLDEPQPVAFPQTLLTGLIPASVSARLTLTSLPPLPFASAITDLLAYRYHCLEQTISKGYAALVLTPQLADALHIDQLEQGERRQRVERALQRLAALQVSNGNFNMWGPAGGRATFLTPYAANFMLDARAAGFKVDDAMLKRTMQRLKEDLLGGGPRYYGRAHADHLRFARRAWSAYVLARVKRAPLGTLRNLFEHKRKQSLTGLPLVHLGIALKLMGDIPRGDKALAAGFAQGFKRPEYVRDYGSGLRDMAIMVALTHKHDIARPEWDAKLVELARRIASREHEADNNDWRVRYSTNEQAALARLARQLLAHGSHTVQGRWRVGDSTHDIPPEPIWSRVFDHQALAAGVRVQPEGDGPLYVISSVSGVPETAPPPDQDSIAIQRDYFTLDGQRWQGKQPLTVGTQLLVRLKIEARQDVPDALLTNLLPGGLEVVNLNLADASQWSDLTIAGVNVAQARHNRDILHESFLADRYVAALDLDDGQVTQLFYLVRAVSPGQFKVPPPRVADMYRPELQGIGKSQIETVKVVQP